MKNFRELLFMSFKELKSIKALVTISILISMSIVLDMVTTISIGGYLKISFSSFPLAIIGALFGPVAGGIAGIAANEIGFFIRPNGAYFPGFMINYFLSGFIYGLMLYKKNPSIKRIAVTKILVMLLVNIGLHTLWLSILLNKSVIALLPVRLIKNIILLPVETTILVLLIRVVEKIFPNKIKKLKE